MAATQRFAGTLGTGQSTYNIAAGASVGNIFAGTMFEQNGPRPRAITIYAVQDTVANADLVTQVNYGTVTAVEDGTSLPKVTAADAGTGPKTNEHELVSFVVPPLAKLKMSLRNIGSAAHGAGLGARILVKHQDL